MDTETGDAERENQKQQEESLSAGEMFGVKLKKIQTKEGMVKKDVAEDKKEEVGVHQKRVIKQANIPLNSCIFLSRSDVKLPKMSPSNQKKGTTERKKSPSPNIPLSKSVHSLTKTVEAADPNTKGLHDASRENVASEEEEEKEEKEEKEEEEVQKNITIHHAESFEIKCSDEVLSIDPDVVTEIAFVKEDFDAYDIHEKEAKIENGKQQSPRQHDQESIDAESPSQRSPAVEESPILLPRVSITVREHTDEEPVYEDLDEELLKTVRQISEFPSTPPETKSTSRKEHDYDELEEEFLKKVNDIPSVPVSMPPQLYPPGARSTTPSSTPVSKDSPPKRPSSPCSSPTTITPPPTPQDEEDNNYDELDEDFLKKLKAASISPKSPSITSSSNETLKAPVAKEVTAEKGITPPGSPMRGRTNTNESTNSSCKSDPESVEKRSSKFKFFRSKRSGSINSGDKKENEESKDSKDCRRGSSTFSKILHVKKSKDKKKKDTKDNNAKAVEKPNESDPEPSGGSKHDPKIPVPAETEKPQDPLQCTDSDVMKPGPEIVLPNTEENSATQLENLFPCRQESPEALVVLMRHDIQRNNEEARCSTYSRTSNSSRDQEPAPSIPEKTRVRAKSPSHDVPQSNRPVTSLYHLISPQEQEVEDRKPVDGYISEKQIQAILNASETRDKRRSSQSRNHGNVLTVPDGSKTSEGTDDRMHQRPSLMSVNSTESDEPLRATNFLSGNRLSSGSGSFKTLSKSYDSDSSGELQQASRDLENLFPEQDASAVHLRTTSRLAESLTEGNRVSLTSPEFTVMEEEGPGTPDATKTTFPVGKEQERSSESTNRPRFSVGNEEDEKEDYFPVMGGDVELRMSPRDLPLPTSSAVEVRTSGIVELKDYLKTIDPDDEVIEVKSSISRLGHSAAVQKLKETSDQL